MKNNLIILVFLITASTMQAQITDGLYAYYPFSGSIEDNFGSFHLENTGALSPVEDRFGQADCAYWFPGNDSLYFKSISDDLSINMQSGWSISLWYKGGTEEGGDYEKLIEWGPQETRDCSYLSLYDGNSPLVGALVNTETYPHIWADETDYMDSTVWHHLVMSINPQDSLFQLYVDNELQGNSQMGISLSESCTGNIKIGQYFRGTIDDIFIYHKGLSPEEVSTLYNLPSACVSDPVNTAEKEYLPFRVKLFPNPSENSLVLDTEHFFERFTILSTDGRILKSQALKEGNIDISQLKPGIYFLQLESAQGNTVKKFVKK